MPDLERPVASRQGPVQVCIALYRWVYTGVQLRAGRNKGLRQFDGTHQAAHLLSAEPRPLQVRTTHHSRC